MTSGVGAAGWRYSDGLGLLSGVTLTDEHYTHIHANVTPLERLAYLKQLDREIRLKKALLSADLV